jgi:hypothetical protein
MKSNNTKPITPLPFESFMNDEGTRLILLLSNKTIKDFQLRDSGRGGSFSTVQTYRATIKDCEFYREGWNQITPMKAAAFIDTIVAFYELVITPEIQKLIDLRNTRQNNSPTNSKDNNL